MPRRCAPDARDRRAAARRSPRDPAQAGGGAARARARARDAVGDAHGAAGGGAAGAARAGGRGRRRAHGPARGADVAALRPRRAGAARPLRAAGEPVFAAALAGQKLAVPVPQGGTVTARAARAPAAEEPPVKRGERAVDSWRPAARRSPPARAWTCSSRPRRDGRRLALQDVEVLAAEPAAAKDEGKAGRAGQRDAAGHGRRRRCTSRPPSPSRRTCACSPGARRPPRGRRARGRATGCDPRRCSPPSI